MAREFLLKGDKVVICGRSQSRVDRAVQALQSEFRCLPPLIASALTQADQAMGEAVRNLLPTVNYWINNAGSVGGRKPLSELSPEEISSVVGTNLIGSLLCCRQAIQLMKVFQDQKGVCGAIFNMDGAGTQVSQLYAAYGATKRSMPQLSASLAAELKEQKITNVMVHTLSPGMVLTDLLLADSTPQLRKFFNAIPEEPQTVARDLVPRIRLVQDNKQQYIKFLTVPEALLKVVTGAPQILFGGRFFDNEGNRVKEKGVSYKANGARLLYEGEELP
ncbi:unnamed protein product [Chrysoparadoxa australica]